MPDAPACVRGLAVVRGEPVVVVDLGVLLGAEPEPIGRFVALEIGDRHVVVAVASVIGVQVIAPETLDALPPLLRGARADVVSQVGMLDHELLSVIAPSKLLDTEADAWPRRAAP